MSTSPQKTPKRKQPDYSYMRYASMGTQMLVIIGLGVFSGYYLDRYLEFTIPVFTLILSLSSVAIAIYLSIKDFLKK